MYSMRCVTSRATVELSPNAASVQPSEPLHVKAIDLQQFSAYPSIRTSAQATSHTEYGSVPGSAIKSGSMFSAAYGVAAEVGGFWRNKAYGWWNRKKPREVLLDELAAAQSFEEWEEVAYRLDELDGADLWRQNATSKIYDFRLIYERLQAIIVAREDEDILGLVSLLRSGLVRNLGNITAPRLFNRACAGTKLLIEDYITQVALAIEYVTALPPAQSHEGGLTSQAKLDLLHDTRQAFGRSTLVLQGGAVFGLCHLGVVKALHLRGLLPRIITGTASGALIAALVGVHTEDELLAFLNGDGIDLAAFARPLHADGSSAASDEKALVPLDRRTGILQDLLRRTRRYVQEGHFLDGDLLEACVRAHVGELTFEEAYARTKRVLNITVATSGRGGVPNLLNYLTAPNVLIYSAALASSTTPPTPLLLYCKDETGTIHPLPSPPTPPPSPTLPLARTAELFNVNHFLLSTTHPSLSLPPTPTTPTRLLAFELAHRLRQAAACGLLPATLLAAVVLPGPGITLVPPFALRDLCVLLSPPSCEGSGYWVRRGERAVWPVVGALKVRCAVEVELDRGYQLVRRGRGGVVEGVGVGGGVGGRRRRRRAVSVGVGG
ncbi:hypothetical protein MMC26_006281 [Xylographa opegraphella]|nr:hypothetical protein [Xylographa opegraphella]